MGAKGPGADWQALDGNFELAAVRPASLCRRDMPIPTLGARPLQIGQRTLNLSAINISSRNSSMAWMNNAAHLAR